MNKRIAGVLAAVLTAAVWGAAASAADAPQFGYVDLRKVMLESKAGKQAKADIEGMVKQRQERLEKEEQKLKALEQAFEKDKLVLTEAQKKEKQKEFETKLQAYRKMAAEAQREVSAKDQEFSRQALENIKAIIREVAREEKLALVFEKHQQPVLYAADGPDLTDKVMRRYDAKFAK